MADPQSADTPPLPPLKQAVAEKLRLDPTVVARVLSDIGVTEERSSRRHAPITLRRLAFNGTKQKTGAYDGPLEFEWSDLSTGLWLALSPGINQIGKSSIFEVAIWALRGRPRALRPEVRSWIEEVELEFTIGPDRYLVDFVDSGDVPSGKLTRLAPGPATIIATFEDENSFESAMGDMMMERFALQPILNVSHKGEDASQVFHGWPLYAQSLFIEGSHPAILGDVAIAGIWWRMLHLFVGTPYAATAMIIGNAITLDESRREREAPARSRPAYAAEIKRLEREIDALKSERAKDDGEAVVLEDIDQLALDHTRQLRALTRLEDEIAGAERASRLLKVERDEARAVLRRLREGTSAKKAFAGLKPACCPRCAEAIPESRTATEETDGRCAVCDRTTVHDDADAAQEAIDAAAARADDLTRAEAASRGRLGQVKRVFDEATAALAVTRTRLAAAEQRTEAMTRQRATEARLMKLEGALEQLRALTASEAPPAADDGARPDILKSAAAIADARMKAAMTSIINDIQAEVAAIALRFGFRGLEGIQLRGNKIGLTVSGVPSSYSQQTAGQRLRLRIALVIAMMRLAHRTGYGHHPGILFIDSPGSEELSDEDLLAMMVEIQTLAADTPGLQIFLASARGDLLSKAPAERTKTPLPSGTMF